MSPRESLRNLADAMALMTVSPKKYPEFMTYEGNKANIIEDWARARNGIRSDVDKIPLIDQKIEAMFQAFESNNIEGGCDIAIELYNMNLRKLK